MTGLDFEAICQLLWGARFHKEAARFLNVSIRTIQRWPYDLTYDIPDGVRNELLNEVRHRSLDIVNRQEMECVLAETEAKAEAQRQVLGV